MNESGFTLTEVTVVFTVTESYPGDVQQRTSSCVANLITVDMIFDFLVDKLLHLKCQGFNVQCIVRGHFRVCAESGTIHHS